MRVVLRDASFLACHWNYDARYKLIDKAQKDKFDKLEMDKGYEFNGHMGFLPYSIVFKKHSQLIHMSHILKRPGMVD